ncbi:3-deoxy-D-manno-octulosonic acid kinase [Dokdonella sp.]|uniref:3-deoxy-D-manno-octulosonic acid kinase n=1 Tax=Dokdonella sp. TaxID=2291710 RepID=UPI001B234026|nr:3-deoxy-D-manno-octulosonic acid kinase [Dokdonella sp.]MBO9664156.1 3-deoxy-D-manno-octulosonic acid kinase [Dokdonella sp.]
MIEAQVQSTANGAIVHDRALAATPDERWFDGAHWSAGGDGPSAGRGNAVFVETPAGACVLRHYHRGGLVAHFSSDRYLWTGARRTRAFREFDLLVRLANAGLPVPRPVAARYVRDGMRYRADLLTRRIANARTLAERLADGSLTPSLAHDVGRTIAAFHEARVWHADLNAHNVLIDADGTVWLIDFDRSGLRKPSLSWQAANLARLRRSLDKLGAARVGDFDARFWHPLLAAYHEALARPESASRGAAS